MLQQCESEHLLSNKINRLVLVCVRLMRSSKNGPLNGTVTKKRDGNGKFGFKNGPSLIPTARDRTAQHCNKLQSVHFSRELIFPGWFLPDFCLC